MPNLKEVRNRIISVSSTQQITKAMKMVSAAKLRKAQDAIIKMRPYNQRLSEILQNTFNSTNEKIGNVFLTKRDVNKIILVVVTSNKGLCGSFNSNVIKQVMHLVNGVYAEQLKNNNLQIICIGKKGHDYFKRNKLHVLSEYNDILNDLTFENASQIAQWLMDNFRRGNFDKIEVIYNQFKNAATQNLTSEIFLPIPAKKENKPENNKFKVTPSSYSNYFIFDPVLETTIDELIPLALKTLMYKILLESNAADHGARMTAMDKATENAGELLKEIRLSYNKARQATITKEIIEIASGAEALS